VVHREHRHPGLCAIDGPGALRPSADDSLAPGIALRLRRDRSEEHRPAHSYCGEARSYSPSLLTDLVHQLPIPEY
jgi:hypothetical protein